MTPLWPLRLDDVELKANGQKLLFQLKHSVQENPPCHSGIRSVVEDNQGVDRRLAVGVTRRHNLPSCFGGEGAGQLTIAGLVRHAG